MKSINIKKDIPDYVLMAMDVLINAGYQSYLTGGCVRDLLTGRIPSDWDIATSAVPQIVLGLFSHTVEIGTEHGTVTAILEKGIVEITSFRIDKSYSDHRHPDTVIFTTDLMQDLSRRDFTINSLALDRKGDLVDLFNGKADIDSRIIRCVGNPDSRFSEDALRLLRCVRFSAQLGFDIHPDTYQSLIANRNLLLYVSKERINNEICKIIKSDHPDRICFLQNTGLLGVIIPEITELKEYAYNISKLSARLSDLPDDLEVRLAFLFNDTDITCARKIMERLRFNKMSIKKVSLLLKYSVMPENIDGYLIRKILSVTGYDIFSCIIRLWSVKYDSDINSVKTAEHIYIDTLNKGYCIALSDLAVNGNDLLDIGITDGRNIGMILDKMFDIVLKDPLMNNKENLLNLLC